MLFSMHCFLSMIFFFMCTPSIALTLSQKGEVVLLTGHINNGDDVEFKNLINNPANAQIKIIQLQSGGGNINAAKLIARLIRDKKLTTLVNAKTDNCASACTLLFSSGIKRHYVNAQDIEDGLYGLKQNTNGLGYHQGSNRNSNEHDHYSENATKSMIAAFNEMGTHKDKDLMSLASPLWLYRISSHTALKYGIATSLSMP